MARHRGKSLPHTFYVKLSSSDGLGTISNSFLLARLTRPPYLIFPPFSGKRANPPPPAPAQFPRRFDSFHTFSRVQIGMTESHRRGVSKNKNDNILPSPLFFLEYLSNPNGKKQAGPQRKASPLIAQNSHREKLKSEKRAKKWLGGKLRVKMKLRLKVNSAFFEVNI